MAINEERLNAFLGKAVGDLGAAISAVLILIGDELGLFRELGTGPLTSAELAARTNTNERYIREWLASAGTRSPIAMASSDVHGVGSNHDGQSASLVTSAASRFARSVGRSRSTS